MDRSFRHAEKGNGRGSTPASGDSDIIRRLLHAENDLFRVDLRVPPFGRRDERVVGGSLRTDRTGRERGSRGAIRPCGKVPERRGGPEKYRRCRAVVPPGGGARWRGGPVRPR